MNIPSFTLFDKYPNGKPPLAYINEALMTDNIPQQVTNRYVTNLINKGRNDTFEVISLQHEQALHDGLVVGNYFDVVIRKPMPDHTSEVASGVTAAQAVRRCLIKFGVTFR